MIVGLDSASMPSAAQAKAARLASVSLWSGYLATKFDANGRNTVGLYSPWSKAGFDNARLCGATPIAFCSGWDDPKACKALAASWNVRLCLDIESGIRGDGSWKQAWLDTSGAGVYGNYGCHNCRAAFHVLAAYPGSSDVQATWWSATPRPPGPCGWQWAGTHTEFGIGVDRGDYDNWFANGLFSGGGGSISADMDARQNELLIAGVSQLLDIQETVGPPAIPTKLDAILAKVTALSSGSGSAGATDPAVLSALGDLKTAMVALQASVSAIKTKTDRDLA